MAKTFTKMERFLKSSSKRQNRQPYGVPAKRKVKRIAFMNALLQRRKHKDDK
jgi:hypothetical protein